MSSTFDQWIFDHENYKSALDVLVAEIELALDGGTPFILPLLGDSRAGKTALLADVRERFADRVSESGHVRVMCVPMPSVASNQALATRIIRSILGNIPVKGKPHEILERARKTMEGAGVRVLMLDEMNHQVEKRSTERAQTKENRHSADWLKELGDLSRISVVVAGLMHVSRIYADNDQLENRGLVPARIEPYAWNVSADRVQYENTLHAAIAHLKDNRWTIEISAELVSRIAYLGGGGYIGKAVDFLARIEECGHSTKRMDLAAVSKAYASKYAAPNGVSFNLESLDDTLLNAAHQSAVRRALRSGRA